MVRHFLTLRDVTCDELKHIVAHASQLKASHRRGEIYEPFKNKVLGMIFEKSSTRTRVSFETGMVQLGGAGLFLAPKDTQLGRGEPIEDSARVLSRMVDMIMIRTFAHDKLERFAAFSRVPVINALTDSYHPCQLLADIQTYTELRGDPQGKVVAWIGDGNNMCHSYINAAASCDFELHIACPEGFEPNPDLVAAHKGRVQLFRTPADAVRGAIRNFARRDAALRLRIRRPGIRCRSTGGCGISCTSRTGRRPIASGALMAALCGVSVTAGWVQKGESAGRGSVSKTSSVASAAAQASGLPV